MHTNLSLRFIIIIVLRLLIIMELGWNESPVREKLPNLIVLDDLANRQYTQLLVDQSIGRNEKSYFKLVPADCSILVVTLCVRNFYEYAPNN